MKDIKGYEGLYAVTSCGKVWSYRKQKFLKPAITNTGYFRVRLYKNGESEWAAVHRLVAMAYVLNIDNKPQVNHKDEDKSHNWANNLEWATPSENTNYGTRNERVAEKRKKPIYCVELNRVFDGAIDIEKEFGMNHSLIARVCNKKRKTAYGYHFSYKEAVM